MPSGRVGCSTGGRGYAAGRSPPRPSTTAAPLPCAPPRTARARRSGAARPRSPRSSSAPVISSRPNTRRPVAAPTSAPDRRRRQRRAGTGQDRQPAARRQHARHRVERGQRLVEQVQRGEAADRVEGAVAERQPDRVAADVGDVRRRRAVSCDRAGEHRRRRVEPDHQPALADRARELAHEVARAAGDVEHGVARPELEQLLGDPALALRPRPERAHQHAAPRRPPPALVDDRQPAREHSRCAGRPPRGPAPPRRSR